MRITYPLLVAITRLLVCCLCMLLCYGTQAQVRAQFTADKVNGCSPLSVSFTNTSTGAGANAQYLWDFGNGNTSTLQHAAAVFTEEKTHTIKLTVTSGDQSSTHTVTVTVHQRPTISFTNDITQGCAPLPVQLTASTIQPGNASIASYHWDFGDGFTEETTSPSIGHTYDTKQKASVSLTVKNNYGCHTTLVQKDIIEVKARMEVDFEADKTFLCLANEPIQLTNKSKGPGTLTYRWDFGNGQSSTQPSPTHVFNTRGTYTVKLTATSSEGCVVTKTKTDLLHVANFTTDIDVPTTVCAESNVTMKALCSPTPDKIDWQVDGALQFRHDKEINYIFFTPGAHTIKLIAVYGSCTQEVTRTVTVNPLPAAPPFEVEYTDPCKLGLVKFKDTSADAVKWEWNFNYYYWQTPEPVQATTRQASFTFTQNNIYAVSLKTTTAAGCERRVIKQIDLTKPTAQIFRLGDNPYSTRADCIPAAVSFKATSEHTIAKYTWRYGYGGTATDAEPTIVFNDPGYQRVFLTFETDKGCQGESNYYHEVLAAKKPDADFIVESPTPICGNTRTFFRSTGIDYTTLDQYWFINGVYAGSSYYNTLDWTFTEKGKYTIQLIAGRNGCQDTVTKVDFVEVLPAFPKIGGYEYTCEDRAKVIFKNESKYAEKTIWDFGDGTSAIYTTDEPRVPHVYTKSGDYQVKVTTINGQCTTTDNFYGFGVSVQMKYKPVLSSPQAAICANEPLTFTISNVADHWQGDFSSATVIQWQYGDGTISAAQMDYNWTNTITPVPYTSKLNNFDPLKQDIRVITRDNLTNCLDTSNYIPLVIRGSIAGYKLLNNDICFDTPLRIEDTSRSLGGNIKKWDWDFGDGQTLPGTTGGIISHKYDKPGSYNIKLKITDDIGCSVSPQQVMQTVIINGPKADFSPSASTIPLNGTVSFTNKTNDYQYNRATWQWDFGDGHNYNTFSPQHQYTAPGTYTVRLTATDPVTGCSSTYSQDIHVGGAEAAITITKSFVGTNNCLPLLASFSAVTAGADSVSWDFGDGTTAGDVKFPQHIYDKPGKYYITITAYGAYTTLTKLDSVIILSPQTSFTADQWEGCPGQTVTWDLTGINTQGYTWDFGDGNTGTAQPGTSTHSYPQPGNYRPTLLMKDMNGCITSVGISDRVTIHPNPTIGVSPAGGAACLGQPITLTASGADTYSWLPAASLDNPQATRPIATPTQTTTYTVEGTDLNGCKSSTTYTLVVHQPFSLQVTPTTTICEGDKTTVQASGADRYNWINNTAGIDNTISPAPTLQPATTTTYTLVGYDRHGCFTDTATVLATVNPRPQVQASKDTAVQPGEKAYLSASATGNRLTWAWTPANYLSCTNCPNPISTPKDDMIYTVTATNQYNCSASDEVVVKLLCEEPLVKIPNAFSPNNDGNNDRFVILGISTIRHLTIYNRWGNKVFEGYDIPTSNQRRLWDGTIKGIPQPTGTYVYYVELQCPKGEVFTKKGTVTLIR